MEEKNTRELIMKEALDMFAAKGYAAVSMRDLAATVGIRASSIYHHFTGKQEIFDALIERANVVKDSLKTTFLNAFKEAAPVKQESFVNAGVCFLTGYLKNSQVEPLLKVLECERFHNEEANDAWQELLFTTPLEHETDVFRMLKERGVIEDEDAKALAAEYQAMIMLAYFTGDTWQLQKQLQRFYQRYFIKRGENL